MADEEWGEVKKDWVEEVSENGDCFSYSYDHLGGAGRLPVSLPRSFMNFLGEGGGVSVRPKTL